MISQSTIDRIRELDIVQVIGHYVELKRYGASFRGLSPFTGEKTPSFYVHPAKQIFKCFSSGNGGDAIRFVMRNQNLTYPQAIEEIARKMGERVEYDSTFKKEDADRNEKLFGINSATSRRFYESLLDTDPTHPAFKEIILKRSFTDDTILQWQIGYAPDAWKFLTSVLYERGLIEEGKLLNLVREKDQNIYDFFRDRVMYPIHDHNGRIAAFGGRAMSTDANTPKYLNSPESPVFNKGQILYGLYFAAPAIRKHRYAYLVEGYTDVISFHQAGFNVTVGTCGTSLTEEQCKLLKRYCGKVIIFPDPDDAGEKSALRSIDLLMSQGFETAVVPMPKAEGKKIDPDELARSFHKRIHWMNSLFTAPPIPFYEC